MQIFKRNMEVEELKELLRGREKRTLEYKRAWNEVPKNMFDTVCAFLNRDGGVIVLGVEDNGQIKKGVDPEAGHQMCKDISNLSNNPQKLSPTFLLQPEEVDAESDWGGYRASYRARYRASFESGKNVDCDTRRRDT